MKLIKCHIENFGKLSNYNYIFEDGLNTMKEENGFGKSTFASFIKAMFYGMEAKRNSKVLIDRKKYMPWQGGAFGGSIEFEINEKKYKIERFFGKKEAEDSFKLYDLSTNLESKDYTSNIGEEIFKLNKEAYERSTFVSGQNIETSMNDSINAKLGNILENENDVNTSEQAIDSLDKAIKNYKKTGDRGEINQKILEKTILEKKLEQSKINEKILQDRKERYNLLKKELKEKEQEREKINAIINKKIQEEAQNAKLENYEILKNNLEESQQIFIKLQEFFKEGIPTDEEIETLIEKCLLIEKYKVEIKNYESSFSNNSDIEKLKAVFQEKDLTEGKINSIISEYNCLGDVENKIKLNEEKVIILKKEQEEICKQKSKDKNISIIWGVLATLCIIAGIGAFIAQIVPVSIGLMVIGIILLCIMLVKINSFKKKDNIILNKNEELDEIKELIDNLQTKEMNTKKEVNEFIFKFSIDNLEKDVLIKLTEIKSNFIKYNDLMSSIDEIFEKQKKVLNDLNELEDSIRNYLIRYFRELNNTYVTYAQEIKMKKSDFLRQKKDYEMKLKAKEEYEKANNIKELQELKENNTQNVDRKELEEKLESLTFELNKINDEKNYNKNQIELLESNLDTVFDIENNIEEVSQKIEEMKKNCDILEKTKKLLETAKEQFSSHYLDRMKKSFVKNIELIDGKEMDVNLDINLNVQINEQGSNKEINYFSTGYKDLIYICMRLSLIDSLFENERPFIILDDPFVNLDEEKIKNAMELLNKLAKQYQIVYFVCHESRK